MRFFLAGYSKQSMRHIAFCSVFAVLIALPAAATTAGFIKPGENLLVEGIPPLSTEISRKTAPYTEFRTSRVAAWHPTKRELLISARHNDANQIHRVAEPGAKPEPLTDFKDPVTAASYQPKQGNFFLFAKGSGGDEAFQISRLDLETRNVTPVSPMDARASAPSWNHEGNRVVYTTVTLDRNNGGAPARTDLQIVDPEKPESGRVLTSFDGGGWSGFRWSPDDKQLVFIEYKSINESHIWLLDVATGQKRRLTTDNATEPVSYSGPRFVASGKRILVTSDRDSEFRRLVTIDVSSAGEEVLLPNLKWDIDQFSVARKTGVVAFTTNEEGIHVLRFLDLESGKEMNRPALLAGVISGLNWNKAGDELAFGHASARSAGDVFSWQLKEGKMTRWTNGASGGVNVSEFAEPKLIRWKSFDERRISGFIYEPPESFKGKRPVFISIHGGPEAQARAGFIGRFNYLVNELGIAVIFPNVRGSAGFGKTFLKLDNGKKREDSVKDIGALLDWIKAQPDLDATRVVVSGGSYGGYMSLAVATLYPDRIAGAISSVGISNFVSFLQNTESYRRDLRRIEYGDERDPEMRKHLEAISPLARADRIKKPLFMIQGRNDPRVPYTEAEQIVNSMKKRKAPVWFLMANDEGHGFAKKSNADFSFYAQVKFVETTLLR